MNGKFTETLSTNTHWNIYYMTQTMIGAGKTVTVTVNVKRPLALATLGQSADKELKKEMNRVKETQLYELADASFFLLLFFFYVSLPKSEHPGNTHKLFLIPRWNPFLYGLPNEGLEKLEKKNERKIRERNGEFNFKF